MAGRVSFYFGGHTLSAIDLNWLMPIEPRSFRDFDLGAINLALIAL
jgi:hypothetical protein